MLHQPLKCGRSITEPKGHYSEFKEAMWGGKCGLWPVGWVYFNLPVAAGKVQGGEPASLTQCVQCVIYPM